MTDEILEQVKKQHKEAIDFAGECFVQLVKLAKLRIDASEEDPDDADSKVPGLISDMDIRDERLAEWAEGARTSLLELCTTHGHPDVIPEKDEKLPDSFILQDLCSNTVLAILDQHIEEDITRHQVMHHFHEIFGDFASQAITKVLSKVITDPEMMASVSLVGLTGKQRKTAEELAEEDRLFDAAPEITDDKSISQQIPKHKEKQ